MRALSVRHPFALAIALGHKPIENRTEQSGAVGQARKIIGQRVAIAASKAFPRDAVAVAMAFRRLGLWPPGTEAPGDQIRATAGHILATVTIDRIIEHGDGDGLNVSSWRTKDRFAIVLADVVRLPSPVPAKGALGLWTVPPDVEALVEAQLRRR